jgi:hypothetical protein
MIELDRYIFAIERGARYFDFVAAPVRVMLGQFVGNRELFRNLVMAEISEELEESWFL